jgi:hypothetical protein
MASITKYAEAHPYGVDCRARQDRIMKKLDSGWEGAKDRRPVNYPPKGSRIHSKSTYAARELRRESDGRRKERKSKLTASFISRPSYRPVFRSD